MNESIRDTAADAVAVITEAINTGHDETSADAPQLEKMHRHDGHTYSAQCWLCVNDVDQLVPHIAAALAEAGLLRTTPAAGEVACGKEPFRPRVWWSPTRGLIEQIEPRWPDDPSRYVRTRDRWVVEVPDDAVELFAMPQPAVEVPVVETPPPVAEVLDAWGAVSGVNTPGCTCRHDGLGLDWHNEESCPWAARGWRQAALQLLGRLGATYLPGVTRDE